jgi:quercetin dioxygenase-like cupin family protein
VRSVAFDGATEARAYFIARIVCPVEATMKTATPTQFLAALLIFGLGLATGLVAQTTSDSPNRAEQKRTDLTGAPGMEVIASIVEYKPGESGELHSHHGVEAAYALQGATLQSPGKDPNVVPTGTTIMNLRDVKHGGFKVVGDTSYKLFTVHIVDKGKLLYDYSR